MMERIINTMFHGSGRAKLFLWSVFALILATILLAVFAIATGSASLGVGAVVAGISAFITSQSMSLQELNKKKKPVKNRQKSSKDRTSTDSDNQSEEIDHGAPMDTKEKERAKARYLASMDAKKMKQLMKNHKVFQKHIFAMIDSWPEKRISQTPAVLWQTSTHLHLLVLDNEAREHQVLLEDIQGLSYQKDMEADPEKDYASFQYANFISKLYKPYLPEYREVTREGELVFVKTLFMIHPGISFTNTSVKGLLELLPKIPLLVDDAVNTSKMFDEYFKEVYRYSLLCKNGVYTLDEYRVKMEGVLEELLSAPLTAKDFSKSLRDMNRYHLITSDYMTKYAQIYVQKKGAE